MEVSFREAFGQAGLNHELERLFEDVTIDHMFVIRRENLVQIYLSYNRLIRKEHIFELERELDRKFFAERGLHCHVIEDYHLSDKYDAAYVVSDYWNSFLLELDGVDHVLHTIMKGVTAAVDGEQLMLTVPDNFVARHNEDLIIRTCERVFAERFHLPLRPAVKYVDVDDSAEREEKEAYIRKQDALLTEKIRAASGQNENASLEEVIDSYLDVPGNSAAGGSDAKSDSRVSGGNDPGAGDSDGERGNTPNSSVSPNSGGEPESRDARETEKNGQISASISSGEDSAKAMGNSSGKDVVSGGNGTSGYGKKSKGNYDRNTFSKQKSRFENGPKPLKASDNPNLIYGRDFEEEAEPIINLGETYEATTIRGEVIFIDEREYTSKKDGSLQLILKFTITDYTDTIRFKIFIPKEQQEELNLKQGDFIKVKGTPEFDSFDKEQGLGRIYGIKRIPDFREMREDCSMRKRVELHCHTKMSDMDGCADVDALIKMAKRFGHSALAITDHGVVQAFADAAHALKKGDDFKILYGTEAYLVDDTKKMVVNERGQTLADEYVVFDIETTGFIPKLNKIIEIGAVKVRNGEIIDRFSEFINPEVPIPLEIEKLTSITDAMVADASTVDVILPRFLEFCKGCVLVAHNAKFDTSFIRHYAEQLGLIYDFTHTDTIELARFLMKRLSNYKLDTVVKELKLPQFHHHRAVEDAEVTAQIFVRFVSMLRERGIETLAQLNEEGVLAPERVGDLFAHHATIFAKNEVGRRNLFKLVSHSHLVSFNRVPKIPKSLLNQYREGLILGSGCSSGELYDAIVSGRPENEIVQIVEYYDFLEIQPVGNNLWQIEDEKNHPTITCEEDIREVNRRIVRYGEQYRKLVCATGDVHYLNPEDAFSRTLIISALKLRPHNESDSLYFRTTDEMLDEFAYLGGDKAEEIVVTNTNRIADMCERISPVRPDKCPPVIEGSDTMLRTICYNRAHEMYGEDLPEIVVARLEKELKSIIGNGFAVMYIIAQKLVWKSVEDGYLVGSRGSVGSSFVATMAGITEVNPLPPHYYCPECHYSDFESEEVRAYAGRAGCDMPDKECPHCGAKMVKDGFDIPFETFLGFKGDKEPDIDLNFSGEYQSKAHKYTEVIFGAGQTFRAGTVGTVADKTAIGYVKSYCREHELEKKRSEIERLSFGITGIRRTTGQHPGGIVVLPVGEDINSFTPIQHPANDMQTSIITTHFDYHKIDHNLLKLDILGHDDPTMLRMLQDLTGIDPVTIPLDDPEVMSLFKDTSALKVRPEDIFGTKLGCLGIPEFGTDFAMQMVIDAKPLAFSDLVRISGLSHGENLWVGNAKELIADGTATISTAICTRDDIMLYLIQMGVEDAEAFSIMEAVRKGQVAKHKVDDKWAVWKQHMQENNVPDWYIESCEKIKYMFPKAHAAAYVMMAWRIAWCKINRPLEYYCAFFSIRAKGFSYEMMCMGKARCEEYLKDYMKQLKGDTDTGVDEDESGGGKDKGGEDEEGKGASAKDKLICRDLRITQEMYARGFEFMPIDLYRAKATSFQVIDGKIMPCFTSIDGLGDKNAELIEMEAAKGPFLSKDDFATRTKTAKTMVETLTRLGILEGLTDSNQMSLFDLM